MNLQQLEQQHAQAVDEARRLLARTTTQAENEGRVMTANEKASIEAATNEAKSLKSRLDRASSDQRMRDAIGNLTAGMTPTSGGSFPSGGGGSLGKRFLDSATFEWLKSTKNSRTGQWSAPASEFGDISLHATTLDNQVGSGSALLIPDVRPGIVQLPTRPLVVADLVMPGSTDAAVVQFMKETTFTNAAAAVAQSGPKPESTLAFTAATSPVQKLAHWIPVTDEMLEDSAQLSSYIDGRLRQGVLIIEDSELLNGTGVSPHLLGFTALPGLAAGIARTTEINVDTVLSQIMAIWTATNIQPDGIVMNPSNWKTVLLSKDTTGNYFGGGPFTSPHAPTLWGLPVALTTAIPAGTALVGCFKTCAQIFRRGGVRVEASNSHASFFTSNLVAIRAEERLALAVYRENAFGLVTNLT